MYPVPYGKEGQAIYSVGRRYVNEILLTGNYYGSRKLCQRIFDLQGKLQSKEIQ